MLQTYEFQHREPVEAALGTTLLPAEIDFAPRPEANGRRDIHIGGYEFVLQAIAHHTGRNADDSQPLSLTTEEQTLLASLHDIQLLSGLIATSNAVAVNRELARMTLPNREPKFNQILRRTCTSISKQYPPP